MEETSPHGRSDGFDSLIVEIRARLLPALVAKWGIEVGSDLCSDVEEYAWEHRAKVTRMGNPLGYLYRVAQSKSRSHLRWMKRTTFPSRFPDIVHEDPSLHDTLQMLAVLTDDQRVCVMLVHAFGRRVRRVLLYRVQDEKLRECWLFDESQRFIDGLWSKEA